MLIVVDNPANHALISEMVKGLAHRPDPAVDGLAGLAHRAGGAAAVLGAAPMAQGGFPVETAARRNARPGLSRLAAPLPILFNQTRATWADPGLGTAPVNQSKTGKPLVILGFSFSRVNPIEGKTRKGLSAFL